MRKNGMQSPPEVLEAVEASIKSVNEEAGLKLNSEGKRELTILLQHLIVEEGNNSSYQYDLRKQK
jgi:hypothetical protein